MNFQSTPVRLAVVSMILLTTGCAGVQEKQVATQQIDASSMALLQKAKDESQRAIDERKATNTRERVATPFLNGGDSRAVSSVRPPQLSKQTSLILTSPTSLSRIASILSTTSGMSVRLDADVDNERVQNLTPNLQGTLEEVINQLAANQGLSVRYEGGSAVFHRFETGVFRSKRAVGTITTNTNIGGSGSAATQSATGGSGNSSVSSSISGSSSFDPWRELLEALRSSLTPAGKVSVMQTSGTIVVTDTPAAVRRAEKIIETDNALATFPITVKLEAISVTDSDSDDLGVNWDLVFAKMKGGNPSYNINFSAPGALSQGSVGSFRVNVPANSGRSVANSDALITALADRGKTTTLLRREFTTLHNVPASIARTQTNVYRARVTPGTASSSGPGETGVEPGSVSTGIKLFMTPTWIGDDNYIISLTYDDSFLRALKPLGEGKQTIDAPETSSTQSLNIAQIKTGYTAVLNVLEIDESSYATRGLSASLTTGKSGRSQKTRFFMLLTVAQGPF